MQEVHPTLKKTHCDRRVQRIEQGAQLDWATAEALAVGSLLIQGKSHFFQLCCLKSEKPRVGLAIMLLHN